MLFLDEPTAGLDPEAARQVTGLVERLSREAGRTVFLCTHNLREAQRLCDRVLILNRGRSLAIGSLDELARSLWQGHWVDIELAGATPAGLPDSLRGLPGVAAVQLDGSRLGVRVESEGGIPDLVAAVARRGGRIMRVNPREHTLEEIYFELQRDRAGGKA